MNTENTIESAIASIETPLLAPVAPTTYLRFTEESQNIPATVLTVRTAVNANGKPHLDINFQTAEGRTSTRMWINTPAAAANTLKQLSRAFDITKFSEVPTIVDKECSLSTRFDDYSQRITVAFINKFNPHANDVVDLDALDAMVAAIPATVSVETAALDF